MLLDLRRGILLTCHASVNLSQTIQRELPRSDRYYILRNPLTNYCCKLRRLLERGPALPRRGSRASAIASASTRRRRTTPARRSSPAERQRIPSLNVRLGTSSSRSSLFSQPEREQRGVRCSGDLCPFLFRCRLKLDPGHRDSRLAEHG